MLKDKPHGPLSQWTENNIRQNLRLVRNQVRQDVPEDAQKEADRFVETLQGELQRRGLPPDEH